MKYIVYFSNVTLCNIINYYMYLRQMSAILYVHNMTKYVFIILITHTSTYTVDTY